MRLIPFACLVLLACASSGHTLGYKKAVAAREKASTVLSKAEEPYGYHADELLELLHDVDAGYTQAQSHSNSRSSKQWLQVKDDVRKFAADWQQRETLGGPYLQQRIKIILGEIDAIIADEVSKKTE